MKKKGKIVNVSKTKYEVIRKACDELGWISTVAKKPCNIFWQDSIVTTKQLANLSPCQKINHFPGIYEISRKNLLSKNLNLFKRQFKDSYSFFPTTWIMPLNYSNFSQTHKGCYIVKPEASSQGKGIYLINNPEQLKNITTCLVQEYITKPLLIRGLKFDLRVYVLISSCYPLRIFIYDEGIARFSTDLYEEPCENNMENRFVHLTNYAVNKKNSNFIHGKEINDETSHKQAISTVFKRLESEGINCDKLWDEICDIAVKTLLTIQPFLKNCYYSAVSSNERESKCFEVLGFDILIDKDLKPWLLEVNFTPSFTIDSPLDSIIKQSLIVDTLKKVVETPLNEFNYSENINSSLLSETQKKFRYLVNSKESFRKYSEIYPNKNKPIYQKILRYSEKCWKTCCFRTEKSKSPQKIKEMIERKLVTPVDPVKRAYTPIQSTGNSVSPIRSRLVKQALEKYNE